MVLTLRALQSSANNKHIEAPLTWDAINQTGQQYGSPDIDYDRFAARWDSDPMLKQLVARFDGHGVVIKTDAKEPKPEMGEPKQGLMDKAAKNATNRAMK